MIKVLVKSFTKDVSLPSKEDEAAILLQERMQEELSSCPEAKGSLYILTNVRIFGQKRNDMDMLVMGFFEGLTIKSVKTKNVGVVKELNVKSVICNVELKSHSAGKVVRKGTDYFVSYSGVWHNASRQCYEAKFSLWNHLADQLGVKPFICDILWFNGLSEADLSQMRGDMPDNALHRRFSFKDLIEAVLLQASVCKDGAGGFCLDSFSDGEKEFQNIVRLFTVERKPKGLTKVKFELISQKNTETDKLLSDIGKKLTIVTGRAGTGKTVQLLQLAFRLADEERANRCLLLTYNHALVSDIQRLIDYTPMPTRVDGRTVSIKTIHSFFHNLMKEFGIDVKGITPLKQNYEACIDFCEKRVEGFNPNSRYTKIKKLQIDFYYAVACYENGQIDTAKEKFSGIISAAPDLYTANVSQKYLDAIEQNTAPDFSETKIVPDEDFRIHYKKSESKIYFRRILFNLLTAISFALVTILCFLSYFESKNNQPSQIETEIMAALDEKYGKSNPISYFYFDKEYYENIFCLADIEDELYFVEIVSNADGVKSVVPLVEKMEVDLNYCVKATSGDFYIDLSVRSSKPAYDSTLSQREVRFKNKTYWFCFNILEENPWIDLQINCMTS